MIKDTGSHTTTSMMKISFIAAKFIILLPNTSNYRIRKSMVNFALLPNNVEKLAGIKCKGEMTHL